MPFISNGTTILNNGAFEASLGNLVFLSEQTGTNTSSINFSNPFSSTYLIYYFQIIYLRSVNGQNVRVNFSTDGGSSWTTKTTAPFSLQTAEPGGEAPGTRGPQYSGGYDQASSTDDAILGTINKGGLDTGSDSRFSGDLYLFEPTSTTYHKQFMGRGNSYAEYPGSTDCYYNGYVHDSSAINYVRFLSYAGTGTNIDGHIKLYGIKG